MDRQQWVRSVAKDASRAKLARARAAVSEARLEKRTAVRRAREACAAARVATREWLARARADVRAEIERLRIELRAAIEHRRAAVRACCDKDKPRVRAAGDTRIAAARAALEQLRAERHTERLWTRRDTKKPLAKAQRSDATEISDQAVEVELSPDELIVWRKVRRRIPLATPRMSRLERFQHWIHDHPGDVQTILEDAAERAYRDAIANEERERAQLQQWQGHHLRKRSHAELRDHIASELDAVPF